MFDDYEAAPIDERLRETLRFLETMTLDPARLDASRALAAGVSREALRDAAYVAASFNVITRFADAIGALLRSPEARQAQAEAARAHIAQHFSWEAKLAALREALRTARVAAA